jgi:alanine dehydrogenase
MLMEVGMSGNLEFGFPKIHAEPGEKRTFLPDFIGRLSLQGAKITLEEGYGSELGFSEVAYRSIGNGNVQFSEIEDVYSQKYIVVLRCPSDDLLHLLRPGSCLISMLHYPTRPARVELLKSLGVEAISLDSLKDDSGRRLVENLRAVGWNGMEAAFKVLQEQFPDFDNPKRGPIQVTLLGVGAVGIHVVQAAIHYSNEALRRKLFRANIPGVLVSALDYDLTGHRSIMKNVLKNTDILVDATQRPDTSHPVISNEMLGMLPEHAVLLDLSVDPYDCTSDHMSVKGIEGIPQGNLDQYIFAPDDPAFDAIPGCVDTRNRRWTVSCYSWPGIYPVECMEIYGKQLRPVFNRLIEHGGVGNISPNGRYFERAICRAMLSRWDTRGD